MNKKTKVAWIGFAGAIIAAIITALATMNSGKESKVKIELRDNKGNLTAGDNSPINVTNIINKTKKIAVIDFLKDADLHLGDNVYPDKYGFSYNPLNQAVYPQGVKGIIYFDKKTNEYLSDKDRPTIIGQALVQYLSKKIEGIDFSCFEWIHAVNPEDEEYTNIIKSHNNKRSLFMLGSTALVAKNDSWGNFYERFAAIGIARSVNFLAECERQGIDLDSPNDLSVTVILHCYHGGIREGQPENFYLQFNDYAIAIPSKTRRMRDLQQISLSIPNIHINFNRENLLYIYVLPWVEQYPELEKDGKVLKSAHFRDIGITHLEIKIEENV